MVYWGAEKGSLDKGFVWESISEKPSRLVNGHAPNYTEAQKVTQK